MAIILKIIAIIISNAYVSRMKSSASYGKTIAACTDNEEGVAMAATELQMMTPIKFYI